MNSKEAKLIAGCKDNDRLSQEQLYRKYADKMYNVCLIYADDEDDACDILQDGFLKVFMNIAKFKSEGSFEGWLRKIMVNTALEYFRKKKREKENYSFYQKHIEIKVENILETLHVKSLISLVNDLPSKAQLILKLYAIEGYSHKEIAHQLDIAEGTSKSQLNRARMLLKESLISIETSLRTSSK